MRLQALRGGEEPRVAVGLIEGADSVAVRTEGTFEAADGRQLPPGAYRFEPCPGGIRCQGPSAFESQAIALTPVEPDTASFGIEATIGIDFHWEQKEIQRFRGGLKLALDGDDGLLVINEVAAETYLRSVVCSEMRASAPVELLKAHAVISRSWLLAQVEKRSRGAGATEVIAREDKHIRWTDQRAHTRFDVCADDHCQRYQGIGRIGSPEVDRAVVQTRGLVLSHEGTVCDTRYSKCCGGVTEDARTAWSDAAVAYLTPVADAMEAALPDPPLHDEAALRAFLAHPPKAFCNCSDPQILGHALNDYDLATRDFFRWQVRLDAREAGGLVSAKLGTDLGRIIRLQAVERGLSGRMKRLRIDGEKGSLVIGKELEIRRALSSSHLLSSAFVVDCEGPAERPDAFVLRGAGWGHGVGLCQIGAAVMAYSGFEHQEILGHYYPGTSLMLAYG
ncbi:MAG: SpoIID/LytB domain-containing protein [Deltaproteobacteria bacterium]|nr:SpoIID/LytB domain-containing protein [Deltaproteobacteria bacterium]